MSELNNLGYKFLGFCIKDAALGDPGPVSAAPTGGGPAPAAPLPPGSIGGKFAERLARALANNLPGPDYFGFREALPTSPSATC